MMYNIINACSDLGVDVDGANNGPLLISKNLNNKMINKFITVNKVDCKKSKSIHDLKKNLNEVNIFNKELYDKVIETLNSKIFPITIGGDHSIAVGSALGSQMVNKNLGIIWIDAHLDYNTFETTITGNLHGLPLAAINGLCDDLTKFHNGNFYNPKNTVVIGYRSNELNKDKEIENAKKAGITIFDNNDIKKYGIENILNKAIDIASNNTSGIHISYDLDIIDKQYAPGVSVPEVDGINLDTAYKIAEILNNNLNIIKSLDLVEFNPNYDINNKTLIVALNILNMIIKTNT